MEKFQATLFISAAVWAAVGIYSFFHRSKSSGGGLASSPLIIFAWPVAVIVKAPVAVSILIVLFLALVGGGERIGAKYDHPVIGAVLGLAIMAILIRALIFRGKKNKSVTNNN